MSSVKLIKNRIELKDLIKDNELVLINCGLTFCAPCKRIAADYEKLSEKYPSVVFCKITVDELDERNEDYIKEYLNLTKYPSFTLMNNGNNIEHIIGPQLDKVENLLETMTGNDEF